MTMGNSMKILTVVTKFISLFLLKAFKYSFSIQHLFLDLSREGVDLFII